MRLTTALFRFSNYLKLDRVPGNIMIGKHRIWPRLTKNYKRFLMGRIENEIENMKYISRTYLSNDEELYADKVTSLAEKQEFLKKLEKTRANKNKIQDRLMSEHLDPLRRHDVWE